MHLKYRSRSINLTTKSFLISTKVQGTRSSISWLAVPQVTRILSCHKNCFERTSGGGSCEFIVSMVSKKFYVWWTFKQSRCLWNLLWGPFIYYVTWIESVHYRRHKELVVPLVLSTPSRHSQPSRPSFTLKAIKNVNSTHNPPLPPCLPLGDGVIWTLPSRLPSRPYLDPISLLSYSHRGSVVGVIRQSAKQAYRNMWTSPNKLTCEKVEALWITY